MVLPYEVHRLAGKIILETINFERFFHQVTACFQGESLDDLTRIGAC
jgi:hypothetical protein